MLLMLFAFTVLLLNDRMKHMSYGQRDRYTTIDELFHFLGPFELYGLILFFMLLMLFAIIWLLLNDRMEHALEL
jgi:uncharacterized membrane protein YwaF